MHSQPALTAHQEMPADYYPDPPALPICPSEESPAPSQSEGDDLLAALPDDPDLNESNVFHLDNVEQSQGCTIQSHGTRHIRKNRVF